MLKLTVPSKTFLLGEYLALYGGPTLILTTAPRFSLEAKENHSKILEVANIPIASPAHKYLGEHQDFFKKFSLYFSDPYQGLGGFGASSAQFALLVALKNFCQQEKINFAKLLGQYKAVAVTEKGYTPSGADVIAQLNGGITYFHKNDQRLEKIAWPFPLLSFALIHTGNKIATHVFLKNYQRKITTDKLKKTVSEGYACLRQADAVGFCKTINNYSNLLISMDLIADHTQLLLNKIKKNSLVMAAKGCGALGADVILVILAKNDLPEFLNWTVRENLNVILADQYAQTGLSIQSSYKNNAAENVILVDKNDYQIGLEEKLKAHQLAILHRAFSIFIFRKTNKSMEVLLQQRAKDKYHTGGLWSNTCCSHPKPGEDMLQNAKQKLQQEMGIVTELHEIGSFRYKAKLNGGMTEHEIDHVFVGIYDQEYFKPNKNEIENYRWVKLTDLKRDLKRRPKKYTPWLRQALHLVLQENILREFFTQTQNKNKPTSNFSAAEIQNYIIQIKKFHIQLSKKSAEKSWNYMLFNFGQARKDKEKLKLQGILLCPKRTTINPNLEAAHKQSITWAIKMGLVDKKSLEKIDHMHFVGVTATSLSNNSLVDLEIVADFTTFFAILDDIWDNQWTSLDKNIKDLWKILVVFLEILRGNYDLQSLRNLNFPQYQNFCATLFDIRQRLDEKNIHLEDFIASVELYFRGYILGFINRQEYPVHSESSYFNIRKFTLGAQTAFELCLALQNITISKELRNHPVFDMITTNGINALAYLNDIISVSKELAENKPENIILLKYYRFKKSPRLSANKKLLQIAFNDVINHYNEVVMDLAILKNWLENAGEENASALASYYEIVTNEIRDNLDYYLTQVTAKTRYHLPNIKYQEISFVEMAHLLKKQ